MLKDMNGVIFESNDKLNDDNKLNLVAVLAELEDENSHKHREFPISQLHKVTGVEGVYRAYINKIEGWRIHLTYNKAEKTFEIVELLSPGEHDRGTKNKVIKSKAKKYRNK
ncbi:hypothetical protein FXF36_14500 [Pseudobutyrivibrio xylanivorans]|uniref:Uncharacterized protein n=2 Tax=Pseudobutyrivibrio xylanivorans TaxID=185007 RepID=A0A5P6VUV2_PSEXY|nr:hypothetical protein FXF36_14500 [Pseudobutyrivibrio xylanivorans]